jgi:hypothetical protein
MEARQQPPNDPRWAHREENRRVDHCRRHPGRRHPGERHQSPDHCRPPRMDRRRSHEDDRRRPDRRPGDRPRDRPRSADGVQAELSSLRVRYDKGTVYPRTSLVMQRLRSLAPRGSAHELALLRLLAQLEVRGVRLDQPPEQWRGWSTSSSNEIDLTDVSSHGAGCSFAAAEIDAFLVRNYGVLVDAVRDGLHGLPSLGRPLNVLPDGADEGAKLDVQNRGYRMLQKQGWQPGRGLGSQQQGIQAPIKVEVPVGRQGLGMSYEADERAESADPRAQFVSKLTEAMEYLRTYMNTGRELSAETFERFVISLTQDLGPRMAQVSATTREALGAGVQRWRDAAMCNTVPAVGDVLAVLERTMAALQPPEARQQVITEQMPPRDLQLDRKQGLGSAPTTIAWQGGNRHSVATVEQHRECFPPQESPRDSRGQLLQQSTSERHAAQKNHSDSHSPMFEMPSPPLKRPRADYAQYQPNNLAPGALAADGWSSQDTQMSVTGVSMTVPCGETRAIIDKTAKYVVWNGTQAEQNLQAVMANQTNFGFVMEPHHKYSRYYRHTKRQIADGLPPADKALVMPRHAFGTWPGSTEAELQAAAAAAAAHASAHPPRELCKVQVP